MEGRSACRKGSGRVGPAAGARFAAAETQRVSLVEQATIRPESHSQKMEDDLSDEVAAHSDRDQGRTAAHGGSTKTQVLRPPALEFSVN